MSRHYELRAAVEPDVDRLVAANEEARRFYRQLLLGKSGDGPRHYLEDRGLSHVTHPSTVWQVGYAPRGWTVLTDHLHRQGFSEAEMLTAGLCLETTRGTIVDRFRDRLVVPIHRPCGGVAGFTARAAPGAEAEVPKYMNTPTTPLYRKSHLLLGLHEQRDALAAGARPVIVEGALDVLAAARPTAGPPIAALSPCGTALTHAQASLLGEAADRRLGVLIAFDDDPAGNGAAAKAFEVLRDYGGPLDAATGLDGLDPAAYVKRHGWPALQQILNDPDHLHPLVDRAVDTRLAAWAHRLTEIEGRVCAARSAACFVATLPINEIGRQVARISRHLDLPVECVTSYVAEAVTQSQDRPARPGLARDLLRGSRPPSSNAPSAVEVLGAGNTDRWARSGSAHRGGAATSPQS